MSKKRFLLFIISLVLLGMSFISLICAMVLHAVFSDGYYLAAIIAIASFVLAFAAIITMCLFGRRLGFDSLMPKEEKQ